MDDPFCDLFFFFVSDHTPTSVPYSTGRNLLKLLALFQEKLVYVVLLMNDSLRDYLPPIHPVDLLSYS
jgi:hypothetical protein